MNGFNPYASATPYYPSYGQNDIAGNVNWVYVNGFEGARNQIVQPGRTAWMMDNCDPIIYVKAVDNMGTVNMKAFRLEEITQNVSAACVSPGTEYAKANDLAALRARIESLEKEIGGLNE